VARQGYQIPPPPDNPFSHIVTNVELMDLFFAPPPRQPFSQKTIVVIYGITVWSDDLSLVTCRILTESFTPPLIFTHPHRDLTLLALLLVLLFHLFFTPPTPFFTREGVHFLNRVHFFFTPPGGVKKKSMNSIFCGFPSSGPRSCSQKLQTRRILHDVFTKVHLMCPHPPPLPPRPHPPV
jgi:hypothetical protein